MSRSGAASGVKAPSLLVVLALSLALSCAGAGAAPAAPPPAQGTPTVRVDAFRYELGDTLTVRGSGLEPAAGYVVRLTSPGGEVTETSVTATRAGTLTASATLDEAGAWTVALTGPGVDARLGVRVVGPAAEEPAPGQGAGEPGPEERAGGAEEPGAGGDEPGAGAGVQGPPHEKA